MKSTYKISDRKYSYVKEFKNNKEQINFIAYGLKAGMIMEKLPSLYKRESIKKPTEAQRIKNEGKY